VYQDEENPNLSYAPITESFLKSVGNAVKYDKLWAATVFMMREKFMEGEGLKVEDAELTKLLEEE